MVLTAVVGGREVEVKADDGERAGFCRGQSFQSLTQRLHGHGYRLGHTSAICKGSARDTLYSAVRWLFLLAYACSGLAGLIYEVSWTRLLTLYIGHTTAAASAVVAAFLGGLALGAGAGGAIASRLSPRRSLQVYIALELAVVVLALLLPLELAALKPLLRWAYGDGAPGLLFPTVRVLSCLVMVFIPALALGATFPMAIRWYAHDAAEPARQSSALYFVNTVGAAVGSLLAGFVLIPALGIAGTTRVGMAATVVAAIARVDRQLRGGQTPSAIRARGSDPDAAQTIEEVRRRRGAARHAAGSPCGCSDSPASPHSCTRSPGRASSLSCSARPPTHLPPRSQR